MAKNSISLVLSGGGARGLAHIGVLKVIDELQIPISAIGGCSMGGLIASLFAMGMPISEIEKIARKYSTTREMMKLVDLSPHRKGIIIGSRYRSFLSHFIDDNFKIEDAQIPLYMNAVDLLTGEEVILDNGNLINSILATTAVPGIFSPFENGQIALADGGVVNNLPVSAMRNKFNGPIVAVDVHQIFDQSRERIDRPNQYQRSVLPEFVREIFLAELIRSRKLTDLQMKQYPPDLLLVPQIDFSISSFFGFNRVNEVIQAGENVMRENVERLQRIVTF